MTTTVTTTNPVRSDVTQQPEPSSAGASRGWAVAGIGAGAAGIATIVLSSSVDVVYRSEFEDTTTGVAAALQDKAPFMFAFHSVTALGAVLMVVFAAGLYRRLRAGMPDSIVPVLAVYLALQRSIINGFAGGLKG